ITVRSLEDLAACLRRLVEDDAVQRLALIEAPRTAEALACLGLDDQFPAAFADRPALCESCAAGTPTPTASPSGAVPTPSRTATPAGVATGTPAGGVATATGTPASTPAATVTSG